jgi:hypothetical protein
MYLWGKERKYWENCLTPYFQTELKYFYEKIRLWKL